MATFAAALLAYLLGSIPFGLLLTRASGLGDIRAIGSGNIGATNVLRTGRKGLAAATLLLDGLKGLAAVELAPLVAPADAALAASVAAVLVVVGHCAPVWLSFRGGKGVATGLGAVWGLDWRWGAAASITWLLVAYASRRSSAGALAAFAAAVIAAAIAARIDPLVATILVAALVTVRHRGNIRRLLAGTEPPIGRRT